MPQDPESEKRAADMIEAAVMVGAIGTNELEKAPPPAICTNAAPVGVSSKSKRARAKSMTAKRRKEIARKAAARHWKN